MTPFDGAALLALLLAFYPIVSAAALALARGERPEYFAGGRLTGSKGDKLLLADGRAFDLIYAAGGPASGQRWQVIPADGGGGAELWPLEPGPLTPIDDTAPAPAPTDYGFESLAAAAYGELAGVDRAVEGHQQAIASVADPAAFDTRLGAVVAEGGAALDEHARALDALDVAELLQRDGDAQNQINGPADEWDAQTPGGLPELPDDTSPWLGYVPDTADPNDHGPGAQPHDT